MKTTTHSNAVRRLHDHLAGLPAGPIQDSGTVGGVLANCWDEIGSDDGGMRAEKLYGRTENMQWNPPFLTFDIERHGGMAMGSSRAEIQSWELDLAKGVCKFGCGRYRQLRAKQANLDVKPMAKELARLIQGKQEDPRITWYADGSVRVHIGKFIPDDGPKQTVEGRRRRLWLSLDELLIADWSRKRTRYTPRNTDVESKA